MSSTTESAPAISSEDTNRDARTNGRITFLERRVHDLEQRLQNVDDFLYKQFPRNGYYF